MVLRLGVKYSILDANGPYWQSEGLDLLRQIILTLDNSVNSVTQASIIHANHSSPVCKIECGSGVTGKLSCRYFEPRTQPRRVTLPVS